MALEPELIADYACVCGEGPLWHPDEKKLYWTDIETKRLFRYDPATGHHEAFDIGARVGGFTAQADGALLLFMDRGAIHLWKGDHIGVIVEHLPEEEGTRFNDVIADPAGRVFCGTMPKKDRPGRLYRLALDGSITLLLEGIGCSNGMGFTPDGREMYYTDTAKNEIYRFDYDVVTGEISNQRLFVKLPGGQGGADGMTVDAEGYVWTALWGGHGIVRFAPDGTEDTRIAFPAPKCSCITFGGEDYTDMYVTTAGGDQRHTDGPYAGALYRLRGHGYRGVPEFRSRIGL
jgi:D-xylonolactonase